MTMRICERCGDPFPPAEFKRGRATCVVCTWFDIVFGKVR